MLNHVTTLAAETESLNEILRELTGCPKGHAYLVIAAEPDGMLDLKAFRPLAASPIS